VSAPHPAPTRKAPPFSESELQVIYGVLQSTWQEIGSDFLSLLEEGEDSMSRADVIEVVLDADYATHHVQTTEQKAVWARYSALPYPEMIAIAKGTFRHSRYGL